MGPFGYIKREKSDKQISAMMREMAYLDHFVKDEVYRDDFIEASRVHIPAMAPQTSPAKSGDVVLWIEGEIYNLDDCAKCLGQACANFEELLISAYKAGKLDQALALVDGYYCAVLYDAKEKHIKLITDRYGMRVLYYYAKGNDFAWAGDVKGLLSLDFVDKTIDETTAPCFLDLGFLLEDHTWFANVKLLEPSTILSLDIETKRISKSNYWRWSDIKQQQVSFYDAVECVSELMVQAVLKRFTPEESIGFPLSGGLDSRLLLAAVHKHHLDYKGHAYTFGREGAEDVLIAQCVAERAGWEHQLYELTGDNWFEPRKDKTWIVDGMLSMMHMHGTEFLPQMAGRIDTMMNGYAGDVVIGGGYTTQDNADKRITAELAVPFYGRHVELANLNNPFYDIPHFEPHIYMNRVRRFTNVGSVNILPYLNIRKPFFDNNLMEFMFSITDQYKYQNRLYAAALLRAVPEFYKDIPWQKTGRMIGNPKDMTKLAKNIRRVKGALSRWGFLGKKTEYTDYNNWLRVPEIAGQLSDLLDPKTAIYRDLVERDLRAEFLKPQLNNKYKNNADRILRAATMEYYLKRALYGGF
ncbi:MAG: hypothetical protein CMH27_08310 [Micavibrio sp.]|nr:hypothetical protein [Micavibrio sp.]|tara:strand:+ start:891 stop:2636 length:1746 start_codon:yes stop_codon:yes gene_type:complete